MKKVFALLLVTLGLSLSVIVVLNKTGLLSNAQNNNANPLNLKVVVKNTNGMADFKASWSKIDNAIYYFTLVKAVQGNISGKKVQAPLDSAEVIIGLTKQKENSFSTTLNLEDGNYVFVLSYIRLSFQDSARNWLSRSTGIKSFSSEPKTRPPANLSSRLSEVMTRTGMDYFGFNWPEGTTALKNENLECSGLTFYANDPQNSPGDYVLSGLEITNANPGDIVVINSTVNNRSDGETFQNIKNIFRLSGDADFTFMDANPFCQAKNSQRFVCTTSDLTAGTSVSGGAIRLKLNQSSQQASTLTANNILRSGASQGTNCPPSTLTIGSGSE